jgi:hypothetical protein
VHANEDRSSLHGAYLLQVARLYLQFCSVSSVCQVQVHDSVGRMLWKHRVGQPIHNIHTTMLSDGLMPLLYVVCTGAACALDLCDMSSKLQAAGLLVAPDNVLTVAASHQQIDPIGVLKWSMPIGTQARCDAAVMHNCRSSLHDAVRAVPGPYRVISAGAGPALCQFLCTDEDGKALLGPAISAHDTEQADLGHLASVGRMLQRVTTALLHKDLPEVAQAVGLSRPGIDMHAADLHDVIAGMHFDVFMRICTVLSESGT